jgi:spermidine dehydrogenase
MRCLSGAGRTPGAATRLRLRSMVMRVQHERGPASGGAVKIAYLCEGRMHEVRGRSVILACYNAHIPVRNPNRPGAPT